MNSHSEEKRSGRAEEKLEQIPREYEDCFRLLPNDKILFLPNNHELKNTKRTFYSFLTSERVQKMVENHLKDEFIADFLVPHKKDPRYLFCKLTQVKLRRMKKDVLNHLSGRVTQKLLQNKNFKIQKLRKKQIDRLRYVSKQKRPLQPQVRKDLCQANKILKRHKLLKINPLFVSHGTN